MRQRNTTDLQTALGELNDALIDLQAVHDDQQKENYTVDTAAYEDPQERAQQALIDLMHAGDGMVDDTDVYVTRDGTEVDLPLAPLVRDADGLPAVPE